MAEITPFGPPRAHQVKLDPLRLAETRRISKGCGGCFVRTYPRARPPFRSLRSPLTAFCFREGVAATFFTPLFGS
jgi:hypothetical protein